MVAVLVLLNGSRASFAAAALVGFTCITAVAEAAATAFSLTGYAQVRRSRHVPRQEAGGRRAPASKPDRRSAAVG